ncbi:MAG: hypothetical protein KA715_09980 [Xanthomonadaceae bacterium]|nr:hypothetical protein [Xanthomonadaceae bacterium]
MMSLLLLFALPGKIYAAEEFYSHAESPCTLSESWKFGEALEPEFVQSFEVGLKNKLSPVQSFSEAIAYRKMGGSDEARSFAEYWISKSLHRAGLTHIAQFGWTVIAAREVNPRTEGIQRASLECLLVVRDKNPTIEIPQQIFDRLKDYPPSPTRSRTAGVWARQIIASPSSNQNLEEVMKLITPNSEEFQLVSGMSELAKKSYSQATIKLKAFLANKKLPEHLDRFKESASILLSRAYYTTGKYQDAVHELKKISRSSNELAQSLTELAWAHLKAENYTDAVGTGISLQSAGMKRTFSPEGLMVMSMALNELCQYPDAIKAISLYKKQYEKAFKWLEKNHNENLNWYQLALEFLQKKSEIPPNVVTEWIRGPGFITRQEEINLLIKEKEFAAKLQKSGAAELNDMGTQILIHIQKIRPKVISTLETLKADETLPEGLRRELNSLREEINHYERLRKGAGPWKKILANHMKRAPRIQEKLVREINDQMADKTKRMFTILDEITDNLQLIEVEIYSGASQDIVWQNAHPDYKGKAKQIDDQNQSKKTSTDWNWGKVEGGLSGQGEVWEDEVGSFKADVVNNCASKEKYMQIRAQN